MVDIRSYFLALKASWVTRLVKIEDANWKLIPKKYFSKFGSDWLIFKTTNTEIALDHNFKNIPQFYTEVFKSWNLSGGGGQTKTLYHLQI